MVSQTPSFAVPQSTTSPFLRVLALASWFIIAALQQLLLIADLIRDYIDILTPCEGALGMFGDCGEQLAISSAEIAVLASWGMTLRGYAIYMLSLVVLSQIIYLSFGFLFLWQQGMNRLGLIVSLALSVIPVAMFADADAFASVFPSLLTVGHITNFLGEIIMITFLYLMPNGRFSPRWAIIPLACTLLLLSGGTVDLLFPLPIWAETFANRTLVGLVVLGIVLQIYRYFKTANAAERQQIKWVILGVVVLACTILLWVPVFGGVVSIPSGWPRLIVNLIAWTLIFIGQYFFPIAIVIAILRYQLWNINVIVSRALIYGGMTFMIVAIYSIMVGGFALLFQTSGNFLISLVATGLIAVIFQPMRERLQRWVNRLMFGERDNPYAVLSQFNQRLQTIVIPQETLTTIVETISDMLKLPFVAIELTEDNVQIGRASVGERSGQSLELPLTYQKENVGRLTVSPRTPNDPFNPQEEKLLADIASQTGPVASATRLTMALQRSRENLVLAREEERRRIRRDLHDGLGPTLASQTLKLDSVLELLDEEDADTASQHVAELKGQTQQMVADIRRLVYELRPPALDELGLLEALRAHFGAGSKGRLAISIGADPEPLPNLPAAIEVAAYRTVLEAVTNVIRHAKADHCDVQLVVKEKSAVSHLHVTVKDDGIGIPEKRILGVGLVSMRERAEELGGRFIIEPNLTNGTRVTTVFPFFKSD